MGRWKDQDGYWVDEDVDDYAEPSKRLGCVCDPTHQWPGYCPGPANCPLCAEPEPEPEDTE